MFIWSVHEEDAVSGQQPNPRVQRTRSSPSARHSPLTRHPLGSRRSRTATAAALLLTVLGLPSAALAKCGWRNYEIHLQVQERGSLVPLQDATLTFFVNDDEETWPIDWRFTEPDRFKTREDGWFAGLFIFPTASGSFLGMDRCNRKLKKLTVVVTREGFFGRRVTFRSDQISAREDGGKFVVTLPTITLGACR